MERVLDKSIVLSCCLVGLAALSGESALSEGSAWPVAGGSAGFVAALLVSVTASSLPEVLPKRLATLPALALAALALVPSTFVAFLPLSAYDLLRDERPVVRACWVLPAFSAAASLSPAAFSVVLLACAVSCLLSLRTGRVQSERASFRRRCDSVRETALALEKGNRSLRENQDMEMRLAALAERERIAREIHDNVGHLLTRSIMQVEALKVAHRDEDVHGELAQLGETLHEAMHMVRESVHDLHDDAFDLEAQVRKAAQACTALAVNVDYRAPDVPPEVGRCFLAIMHEALSNATRHGDAHRASVSVASYPAFYRLVVHDDGSVPPPAEVLERAQREGEFAPGGARRGMGLATMRERAREFGGILRLDYDRGFKVLVTIPKGMPS